MSNSISQYGINQIILTFECIIFIISFIMIIIGILQNKESQNGLAALNGGNDELFANSKERGKEKIFSIIMFSLGSSLAVLTIVISVLTNIFIT